MPRVPKVPKVPRVLKYLELKNSFISGLITYNFYITLGTLNPSAGGLTSALDQ